MEEVDNSPQRRFRKDASYPDLVTHNAAEGLVKLIMCRCAVTYMDIGWGENLGNVYIHVVVMPPLISLIPPPHTHTHTLFLV